MIYTDLLTSDEFDNYATQNPLCSIFQTSSWAAIKSNWKPIYIGVKENNKLIGACMFLIRSLPAGLNFAYAPRGPLLDYANKELVSFFFENCKKTLRKEKVVLAKFDPNIIIDSITFDNKAQVASSSNNNLVNLFKNCGCSFNGYNLSIADSIQPRIQLGFPINETWEDRIPSKTMKKVRASLKKGIEIKQENNVSSLVQMVHCTEQRHQIKLRNETYFNNILNNFGDNACVLSGYLDDNLVSACLLVRCKNTTEILYSGYDDNYKHTNSTYPLRYESIKWAIDNNCTEFNFGGVEGTLDDGLTMFKSSFNPNINVFIGEFDILPIPILSHLLKIVFPKLKKMI